MENIHSPFEVVLVLLCRFAESIENQRGIFLPENIDRVALVEIEAIRNDL